MAKFDIISKGNGKVLATGCPKYTGTYLGVPYVEFTSIESPTLIDWSLGDYVDYYRTGLRYKLYSLPIPMKQARSGAYGAAFVYSNVKFYSAVKDLEIAPFRDIVPRDNNIHFTTRPEVSTYENVYGIAKRLQECINDIFPNKWRIEVYDTDDADLLAVFNEARAFSVSNGSCLSALSEIYEVWKNVGWIHTYDERNDKEVITIGRSCIRDVENTSDAFVYGVGNGLTSIKKAAANEDEFATRLYIYGSERNIQTRYYNGLNILNAESVDIRNLMLPTSKWGLTDGLPDARKAYLQADDAIIEKYGLIPRTLYFDGNGNEEIYPSITGLTMAQVRQAMIDAGQGSSPYLPQSRTHRIDQIDEAYESSLGDGSKEDTEKNRTFNLGIRQLGFDIAVEGKKTNEGYATISMKSGDCAGREFKVRKYSGMSYNKVDGTNCLVYEVEKSWDESLGMGFPNTIYPIRDGDEFVLLDIPMPEYYITLAEKRLLEAGEKMLADYTRVSAFYEPAIDPIQIKKGGKLLKEGMFMQITDTDIIDTDNGTDYVLIDTLTIDEKAELPKYSVTLREQKRAARTYSALEDMIEDAKESTKAEIKKERQYNERRFSSTQETIDMIAGAFENFSNAIDPITIKTMATIVGDESLQFKFTESIDSLVDEPCPISYFADTKQMKGNASTLVHMTLGINDVTVQSARSIGDYRRWSIFSFESASLDNPNEAYYVYVQARKDGEYAEYYLSPSDRPMKMDDEESPDYYFLVGILNSENMGTRDFVTLYGFTEILPGQITTDLLRSGNGNLIIDLANAIIEAKNGATIKGTVTIGSGSSGLENLSEWEGKQKDINEAKATAKSAQDRADDLLYLEEAFGKGQSLNVEGVVMAQMVAVSNPEKGVEAFINGSDFAKDEENNHGKLLLAAGIPEGDLEASSREAETRIYEDGYLATKSAKIGSFSVSSKGFNLPAGEFVNIGTSGNPIWVQSEAEINFDYEGLKVGDNVSMSPDGFGGPISIGKDSKGMAVFYQDIYSGRVDFYHKNGTFSGLRPSTRVISGSSSNSSRFVLSEMDFSVLVNLTSGTCYLELPSSPLNGQEYFIETKAAALNIKASQGVYSFYSGKVISAGTALEQRGNSILRFKYYSEIQQWTVAIVFMQQ